MRKYNSILVTGGAGFIGSHLVQLLVEKYPETHIINVDDLTYAGNLMNLQSIEQKANYTFEKASITDAAAMERIFDEYQPNLVLHLAAESHVDRSISNPMAFVETNVMGTVTLLNMSKKLHAAGHDIVYYQISTDEVYGSLGPSGYFTEATPYQPSSPYSASKASADHFVRAYAHTYHLPTLISNCSNNYGPYQFPEKLIPLMINNIKHQKSLPVYGDGSNVRDWLYVQNHVEAIDLIAHKGQMGETYNVGGQNEMQNIDMVELLCDLVDDALEREKGSSRSLITFVKDRPGHDARYAIDASKLAHELDWRVSVGVAEGMKKTIAWYLENADWMEQVTSGAYQDYYKSMYANR